MFDLVGVGLVQQVFGFGFSVVVIRRQNPVHSFFFVHLPIVVFVSELRKLLTFCHNPLWFFFIVL